MVDTVPGAARLHLRDAFLKQSAPSLNVGTRQRVPTGIGAAFEVISPPPTCGVTRRRVCIQQTKYLGSVGAFSEIHPQTPSGRWLGALIGSGSGESPTEQVDGFTTPLQTKRNASLNYVNFRYQMQSDHRALV